MDDLDEHPDMSGSSMEVVNPNIGTIHAPFCSCSHVRRAVCCGARPCAGCWGIRKQWKSRLTARIKTDLLMDNVSRDRLRACFGMGIPVVLGLMLLPPIVGAFAAWWLKEEFAWTLWMRGLKILQLAVQIGLFVFCVVVQGAGWIINTVCHSCCMSSREDAVEDRIEYETFIADRNKSAIATTNPSSAAQEDIKDTLLTVSNVSEPPAGLLYEEDSKSAGAIR